MDLKQEALELEQETFGLEYMWADAARVKTRLLSPVCKSLAKRNPLRWSSATSSTHPAAVYAQLQRETCIRPVRLRKVGRKQDGYVFDNPEEASKWIFENFQEDVVAARLKSQSRRLTSAAGLLTTAFVGVQWMCEDFSQRHSSEVVAVNPHCSEAVIVTPKTEVIVHRDELKELFASFF